MVDSSPVAVLHDRRRFIAFFGSIGLSSTLLPGALWAQVQQQRASAVTKEMLACAEGTAGLKFSEDQRAMMLEGLNSNLDLYKALRRVDLDVSDPPSLHFNPALPGMKFDRAVKAFRGSSLPTVRRPRRLEDVAFWSVARLASLIRTRQASSVELTRMYLERLRKYGPLLNCVVTLTEELALEQARRADSEIAAGRYRGQLHGIPWGAKDLIAKKGYPTTWGAPIYREQMLSDDATVVSRLEDAGAVLVAKLSTGELAHADVWFGGKTRNPWAIGEGSGGSSAGPAAATAAGLVGFSIGTETGGSIIEPAAMCGASALRPTYGRVSRHGVMPGAWSFDKIGPLCRTVEDCAIVFDAVRGPDDLDLSVTDLPFNWDAGADPKQVRLGFLEAAFAEKRSLPAEATNDAATLRQLRSLGFRLKRVELPDYPIEAASLVMWFGEIGSVWDDLVRSGQDALLTRQDPAHIGNLARMTHTVPAVDATRASRVRTKIMHAAAKIFDEVDVYVAPFGVGPFNPPIANLNLQMTNMTGHPAVVVPNGFARDGRPTAITFIGKLYGEAETLLVAKAYQDATGFHLKHPRLSGP